MYLLKIKGPGSQVFSKTCQASNLERFVKIHSGLQSFSIFGKRSILYVRQGFEYLSTIWSSDRS